MNEEVMGDGKDGELKWGVVCFHFLLFVYLFLFCVVCFNILFVFLIFIISFEVFHLGDNTRVKIGTKGQGNESDWGA